jgi:predicted GH43/DUF377 family glycosyl hydrolase
MKTPILLLHGLVIPIMLLLALQIYGCSNNSHTVNDAPEFVWERYSGNPIFPAEPGTWRESQTANPDLLLIGDVYYMYFRGQEGGHDRIGVATIPKSEFDGYTWNIRSEPIIDVGGPGSWDERHALDPAAILVDGTVYLYYTGVSPLADRAICLAVSEDGIHFTKYENNPVVIGGAPEVVYRDGTFFLYFWKEVPGKDGFQIHYATSDDGFRYTEPSPSLALAVGPEGEWDSFTVETQRIFKEGDLYYMVYCGSDRHKDYPFYAGLATSKDLIHWEKYEDNPIFSRGEEGEWDEGAIWFTTVEKIDGIYYMWYEGYGGGTARTEAYGSYLVEGRSQVGMATMAAPYFYVPPDEPVLPEKDDIAKKIIAMEREALDRWGKGDPDGFLEISAEDVVYFDPFQERRLNGHAELKKLYDSFRGEMQVGHYEMIDPVVHAVDSMAVLTFNLLSSENGKEYTWNCTEVYRLMPDGAWKIIQTHWSFTKPEIVL